LEVNRVLLDTSGYSAFLRGDIRIHRRLQEADAIFVNPIILGELKSGFARGRHRHRNEQELERFLASPRVEVVPIDEGTSERYAVLLNSLRSAGTPIPTNDVWIASSAMQYGLQLVTTDHHFRKVREVLVQWFDPSAG
jgi:tRNA(fMet)-specific endonuclease VapC